MGLLKELDSDAGYLKAGFLGFPKAGKTYTAMLLAIGTRKLMDHPGPIAMFDTEGGSDYIKGFVQEKTGKRLIGVKSRAYDDLLQVGKEALKEGVSVLIVDSVTHIWRELQEAYLAKVNQNRAKKNLPRRHGLEFQDWGPIKRRWEEWTDFYLNSPLHIIICGRAGYEYDFDVNEETGKKELIKTGTKMKTESEFGFEPSLLIEMERIVCEDKRTIRRARILGDRFGLIDGKACDNPNFEFFKPHVERLIPKAHSPIDTAIKSDAGIDDDGNDDRKLRTILLEEIQGELVKRFPGQTVKEKSAKAEIIGKVFATQSWTAVECMSAEKLRTGLALVREMIKQWREE